jgi:hypothetical protein
MNLQMNNKLHHFDKESNRIRTLCQDQLFLQIRIESFSWQEINYSMMQRVNTMQISLDQSIRVSVNNFAFSEDESHE